ncbi:MAG: hypothetical protein E6K18_08840 [Methanobacteriota archaeon]|nr:MAG: hypothetical protein E6K18_08840 [Euryarchaeota archaeon]
MAASEGLRPIHTYTHACAYARLHALKRNGESFSDVVDRLTGKFALLDLVGILDAGAAGKLRSAKRGFGKRLRKGLDAKAG